MNYYMKRLKITWVALMILAIFVILVGFMASNRNVAAQPQEDVTLVLSEEDTRSGITYAVAVDNLERELLAKVEYDRSSMESIGKYQEFNNRELNKFLQDMDTSDTIPLKITFSSPLTQEDFTEFVKQYEIDVDSYYIYMLESDGNIATIQGTPSEDALVPSMLFNTVTNSISEEYSPGVELLGWVEVDGIVQVQQVPQLTADKQVFLVDVMQLFLESKLTDEALANAGVTKDIRRDLLQVGFADIDRGGPLAWNLYYLGNDSLDTQP